MRPRSALLISNTHSLSLFSFLVRSSVKLRLVNAPFSDLLVMSTGVVLSSMWSCVYWMNSECTEGDEGRKSDDTEMTRNGIFKVASSFDVGPDQTGFLLRRDDIA